MYRWRKADASDRMDHCPGHESKNIFYARTYTPGKGYEASETNQLISNFKMGPKPEKPQRLPHRDPAIRRFAHETAAFLRSQATTQFLIVPIPASKLPSHALYDDRVDRVAALVEEECDNVGGAKLLRRFAEETPMSRGGERGSHVVLRSVRIDEALASNYGDLSGTTIALLDDILTSGGTFEGCRTLLFSRFPQTNIIGVFWAKSKDLPEEEE